MPEKKITFDSFMRNLIVILIIVGLGLLVKHLSSVLLPFAIAWLLAYMIYPLVIFLQNRCRLRNRILSISVALWWDCSCSSCPPSLRRQQKSASTSCP